jgi:hypothetical protein
MTGAWNSITFAAGKFVAVCGDDSGATPPNTNLITWSSNGIDWNPVESPDGLQLGAIYHANGLFVGLPDQGPATQALWSESGEGPAATFLAYDADAGKTISDIGIVDRFGVDPTTNLNRFGIYDLTEQPTYPVQAYVAEGGKYQPIKDHTVELASAQEEAAQANARLDAANAQLAAIKSDFEARITALEANGD